VPGGCRPKVRFSQQGHGNVSDIIAILGVKRHGMHHSPASDWFTKSNPFSTIGEGPISWLASRAYDRGRRHINELQSGRKIIFRYAKDFSSTFDRASQPSRIIIVWIYDSESGQPEPEEHRRMNLLEDSLGPILNQDDLAILVLVTTGENLRAGLVNRSSYQNSRLLGIRSRA
jgi:hypothetical protein